MSKKTLLYRCLKMFTAFKNKSDSNYDENVDDELKKLYFTESSSCIKEAKLELSKYSYDLDIIIPVYNVENYLEKCLEKACNQKTKYKYRVIIINDGSTDSSLEICKKYESRSNVLLINQKNQGVSAARNTGLNYVDAEYVMFVDSDDYLCEDAVQNLISVAKSSEELDIIEGGYNVVDQDNNIKFKVNNGDVNNAMQLIGYPWGKIYKSIIFKNIRFPVGYWYEDTVNHMIIYPQCKKVKRINKQIYNYRINNNGICASSSGSLKSLDSLWVVRQLYNDRKKLQIEDDQNFQNYMMQLVRGCYSWTKKLDKETKMLVFKSQRNFYLNIIVDESHYKYSWRDTELINAFKNNNYSLYKLNCLLL